MTIEAILYVVYYFCRFLVTLHPGTIFPILSLLIPRVTLLFGITLSLETLRTMLDLSLGVGKKLFVSF